MCVWLGTISLHTRRLRFLPFNIADKTRIIVFLAYRNSNPKNTKKILGVPYVKCTGHCRSGDPGRILVCGFTAGILVFSECCLYERIKELKNLSSLKCAEP